jgi:hypothetical protein
MASPDEMAVLINHVGYDSASVKRAVVRARLDAGNPN